MKVITSRSELDSFLSSIRKKGVSLGFVPTMGALHAGHMDLLRQSTEENDFSIVSVFVNRLQFNNSKDFENYPKHHEQDIAMLSAGGCDAVFMPDQNEMYPDSYRKIELDLGMLDKVLEGPMRPGHFDGVVQVVYRLFDYLKPDKAYFGLKDYQQCLVIKTLRQAFFPGITLRFCPTVRLASGLAMSSRNELLSEEDKQRAASLYRILNAVKDLSGHIVAADALGYGKHLLEEGGFKTEYLALAHADTLAPLSDWQRKGKNVLLLAAWIGGVRLIDNITF